MRKLLINELSTIYTSEQLLRASNDLGFNEENEIVEHIRVNMEELDTNYNINNILYEARLQINNWV